MRPAAALAGVGRCWIMRMRKGLCALVCVAITYYSSPPWKVSNGYVCWNIDPWILMLRQGTNIRTISYRMLSNSFWTSGPSHPQNNDIRKFSLWLQTLTTSQLNTNLTPLAYLLMAITDHAQPQVSSIDVDDGWLRLVLRLRLAQLSKVLEITVSSNTTVVK